MYIFGRKNKKIHNMDKCKCEYYLIDIYLGKFYEKTHEYYDVARYSIAIPLSLYSTFMKVYDSWRKQRLLFDPDRIFMPRIVISKSTHAPFFYNRAMNEHSVNRLVSSVFTDMASRSAFSL